MQAKSERHVSLAEAHARIDARATILDHETMTLESACGRVLAGAFVSPADRPAEDIAAWGGFAVQARDTEGAHDYGPVLVWPIGPVSAGEQLPADADAVLALQTVHWAGGPCEVNAPVAPGSGVERRGWELAAGDPVLAAGRRLRPQDVALLAAFGIADVTVLRRPLVRLLLPDGLKPMLRSLVSRDGGVTEPASAPSHLVLGGPGVPAECVVALRPGEQAGLGALRGVPAVLLPTEPLACLAAYELLAGRAVRRRAGLPAELPHAVVDATLERKIASELGTTDLVQVRLAGSRAMPLGSVETGGLVGAVRADGFVVVPDSSEGFIQGAPVRVHLYHSHGVA